MFITLRRHIEICGTKTLSIYRHFAQIAIFMYQANRPTTQRHRCHPASIVATPHSCWMRMETRSAGSAFGLADSPIDLENHFLNIRKI